MSSVVPTPAQAQAMIENGPEGPIVMVNLLKYRAKAAYEAERKEAQETLSGREAYQRYGMVALQEVAAVGGRPVWGGPQKLQFIGEGQDWDDIVCVYYPSRQAFLEMTQKPSYLAAHYHRDAGLERTALICCGAGMAA